VIGAYKYVYIGGFGTTILKIYKRYSTEINKISMEDVTNYCSSTANKYIG